jgi:ribosomal protein S18 acetylase RimI-like enzyme
MNVSSIAQRLPGSLGVVSVVRADNAADEDAWMQAAIRHLDGVKVIQAFLSPQEMGSAEALLRNGFRHVTRVIQMRREGPPLALCSEDSASRLRVVAVADADMEFFRDVLVRSHADSLDCPELDRVRSPQEMLDGYRDCAPDLSRWWLALDSETPVGVLILSTEELTFVGVVPEHRGRGIGRFLAETACRIQPSLSLIVDVRNALAIQLYGDLGFAVIGTREVFLNFRA